MWKMIKSHFHGIEWKGMWKGIREGKRRLDDKPFISMRLGEISFMMLPLFRKFFLKRNIINRPLG